MRHGWVARALVVSLTFQAALSLWPSVAVPLEWGVLVVATGWATVVHTRAVRSGPGPDRTARLAGAAAMTSWLAALLVYGVGLLNDDDITSRMLPLAVLTQLALLLAVVAILTLPGLRLTRSARLRMALDALCLSLSLASLAWAGLFGVGRVVNVDEPGAVALLTIGGALLVVLSASLPIFVSRTNSGPTALGAFACGIGVMAIGVFGIVTVALAEGPSPETAGGGALLLGVLLLARTAQLPLPTFQVRSWENPSLAALGLPYAVMLVLAVVAAVYQFVVAVLNPILITLLLLLTIAVLTRQFVSLTMNAHLAGELTRQRARLAHQAFHDPLTGLANRTLVAERLDAAVRDCGPRPAVLLVDLDGFKAVNDTRGHAAGDELLIAVAHRLRACVRNTDTVGRMGGDEFAVVLPGAGRREDAVAVAQVVLDRVARPVTLGDSTVSLRASVGVAVAEEGATAETLLRDADLALYRAKHDGKNQYRVADRELSASSLDRMRIEEELRRAVESEEFTVYYQPIVALPTGRVVGAEALLRWRHPERGLLTPDVFVATAEAAGLLPTLDRMVLRVAVQDVGRWRTRSPEAAVSVNVCAAHLAESALVAEVAEALLEHGVPASALTLEITETALVADLASAGQTLRELTALGVRIALDDFGTGYSSLTYLRTLPIHTLKIDRSFVRDLDADPRDEAVTRAILGLAETLGLRPVAEGVEDRNQAERLTRLGCGHAQGFLFGAPVPFEEMTVWSEVEPSGAGQVYTVPSTSLEPHDAGDHADVRAV